MSQLTVSKLADEAGTSSDTVRYYERIGLLPEPDRSPSGYRLYEEDAIERVRFIKRTQRLGLRLEEIGQLLEIQERGLCPCGHTRALLQRRAAELDEEMAAITQLREDIQHMLDDLPPGDQDWQCASAIQIREKPKVAQTERKEVER